MLFFGFDQPILIYRQLRNKLEMNQPPSIQDCDITLFTKAGTSGK